MSKIGYTGKLMSQVIQLAKKEKAYWLAPLIVVLLLIALIVVGGQAAAPFIYTLF